MNDSDVKQNDSIAVVFSTDFHYLVPTYIAVYSLLKNHRNPRAVNISILVSEDVTPAHYAVFDQLENAFSNYSLQFVRMGNAFRSVKINTVHITVPTMYRLRIPRILRNTDKCIYLDSDVIVEDDIAKLYDMDLEGQYIGGALEILPAGEAEKTPGILGIPGMDQYINAGVLLLNLRQIREDKADEQLESLGYHCQFQRNDQDVINAVCYGHIRLLPIFYNFRWMVAFLNDKKTYHAYGKENLLIAKKHPVILHYFYKKKPWEHRFFPYSGIWWKYMKMQDARFRENILEPMLARKKKERMSLIVRMKDMTVMVLFRLGLYGIAKRVLSRPYAAVKECFKSGNI